MTIDVAITAADGQQYGHVTSMALNADGTRLYATVPVSEMYGPNGWVWQGNTTPGEVIVINVDERDRPAPGAEENSQNWRGVIKSQTFGGDPFQAIAVPNNPDRMVVSTHGERGRGVIQLEVTGDSPPACSLKQIHPIPTRLT